MSFIGGGIGVLGDGQEVEDPAAAVVDADDLERRRPRGARPAGRRRRAGGRARRSGPRSGAPWRWRRRAPTTRRRRSRSRRGWRGSGCAWATAGKYASTSRIGIDELTQTTASSGSSGSTLARILASKSSGAACERRGHHPIAAPPALEPAVIALPGPHLHGASPERSSGRRGRRMQRRAPRASWARARRRADRSPPAEPPPTQLRRGFEVGMSPTLSNEARRVPLREVLAPGAARRSERSRPRGRDRRTARRTSVRRAAASPSRVPAGTAGVRDVLVTRSAHDGPMRLARRSSTQARGRRRSGGHWRARAPRSRAARPGGPSQSAGSSSSGAGASGSRSGKFRWTGPGPAARGGPVGAAGERAVVDGGVAARVVGAHLHEPLRGRCRTA